MNITVEFNFKACSIDEAEHHIISPLKRLLQFVRLFKCDDINKSYILLSD